MIIEDLTDARILVELRRQLSFVGAARQLRIPAATLSRRVSKLEERAGITLFERTTRAVGITPAGMIAADRAERILREAEAADLSLEELRAAPAGIVRVSTPIIFGQAVLGPIVSAFVNAHPACSMELELSDRPVDLVEETVDVVVRVGPVTDEALLVKPMGLVHAGLYRASRFISDDHDLAIDDLQTAPLGLLHPGYGEAPQLGLVSASGEERKLAVAPRLVCLNPWLLRQTALSSDLIVVLPEIVAGPDLATGTLRRILPDWFARRVPVHLAFTSRRLMRPAVRAFIDLASQQIPQILAREHGPLSTRGV